MNLEKAIEILATDVIPNYPYAVGKKARAIQLGIEALKREQLLRSEIPYDRDGLLPGETED